VFIKNNFAILQEVSTDIQIQLVDVSTMVVPTSIPKMVLDNYDIGRGRGIPKGMDGYHVITLDVKTWHVHENQSILLPDESFGQFHSGNTPFLAISSFGFQILTIIGSSRNYPECHSRSEIYVFRSSLLAILWGLKVLLFALETTFFQRVDDFSEWAYNST